jgi:hypothetical protein
VRPRQRQKELARASAKAAAAIAAAAKLSALDADEPVLQPSGKPTTPESASSTV